MEKYYTLKDKKDFESFRLAIPSYLKEISAVLDKKELSFDENEISMVCEYFIKLHREGQFQLQDKKKLMSYIGEAFIKTQNGEWAFTGKRDSFAINEPVITKYKNEGIRYSPSETIFKMLETGDRNYFNSSMIYMDEFQKKTDKIFAELFPKKRRNKPSWRKRPLVPFPANTFQRDSSGKPEAR